MAMEIRRPLKRALPKLGPPDIYPQDPKQKEDELTSVNVKQGYTCAPLISGPNTLDEFGSAKNANIDAFGVYFSALLSEKHRINTLKDTQKKKQLVNTKEIWYVHAKTKHAVDNWFRDLANGTKSLGQLGKRIPIFNSKEGMFAQLYESHVPLAKAVWFIKMSAVHAIALSESSSKSKKRQVPDQYQELTAALNKYLREISIRMFECYQQSQQMQQPPQQQQQLTQQQQNHLQPLQQQQLQFPQHPFQQQLLLQPPPPPPPTQQQQQQLHQSQQLGIPITGTTTITTPATTTTSSSTNSILQTKSAVPLSKSSSTASPLLLGLNSPANSCHNYHQLLQQQHNSLTNCYTSSLLNHQPNFTANLHTSVATLMTSHTASVASLSAASTASLQIMHEDFLPTFNQWQYQTQLARYLFDEGLLDQYDFLCFLLELIERKRPINELVVKIVCPLILEYVIDFSRSAVLSRRLAHVCAKKLSQANQNLNAIYILSSILQVICIECPTAMVKHHIVDSKLPQMFQGSPLDHLPCLPSSLPMLESDLNFELRKSIHDAEREILQRSAMADSKWSCDSSSGMEHSKGGLVNRLLAVMDILDNHNFDKIDSINSIDTLYPKIFPSQERSYEEQVIKLLCEWATTTQRTGEQRALVVAKLLEKHQAELQAILVQFLDENAPINQESQDDKKAFNNLVLLFSEFIRCDVFSHYNYMCTLISRGMFNDLTMSSCSGSSGNNGSSGNGVGVSGGVSSNEAPKGSLGFSPVSSQHNNSQNLDKGHGLLDMDDVDADLGKILQDIKEGQQDEAADILLPDYLASTTPDNQAINESSMAISSIMETSGRKTEPATSTVVVTNPGSGSVAPSVEKDKKNPNEQRHMTFVKHFPVPYDDESYMQDINQRNILLYGFGKEREDAKHAVKKLKSEIGVLFKKKACIGINDGGKIRKFVMRDGFNPEAALHKFETLNHHDQHMITNSFSTTVPKMFSDVSNGEAFFLPVLESVSFVIDLFTIASNVSGLLELVVLILEELPDVEAQIKLKCPALVNNYTHSIALCIIGVLYRYHSCVLLLPRDELCSIIESLHDLVSHIPNPGSCTTSAERVIFCYLYDLYSNQTGRLFDQYSSLTQRIKQAQQNVPPPHQNTEREWTPSFPSNIAPYIFNQLRALQVNEMPGSRYRFVCDAIYFSATSTYPDTVNDIAVLSADATAKCPALTHDWLFALQALCCFAHKEDTGYRLLLSKINISDPQVMDRIAIFAAILVARRCLNLVEFITNCAIPAILAPLSPLVVDKQLAEPQIRLTCHLLLALFRNRDSSGTNQNTRSNLMNTFNQAFPNYGNSTPSYGNSLLGQGFPNLLPTSMHSDSGLYLKYLCDHHLLRSACCNTNTECHITLLKAIRLLQKICANPSNDLEGIQGRVKTENHFDDVSFDGLGHINKDLDAHDGSPDSNFNVKHINLQTANLNQFADTVLRLLCSQRWLHDKCQSDSGLFTTTNTEKNILLDSKLDIKQSQRLLYMICYNKSPEKQADVGLDDQGSDQVASIVKMFENLDVWSMRLSLMRLQFMFAYCKSQSNVMLNDWLDNLAKAVVEFFQKTSQENETQEKETTEQEQSGDGANKANNKNPANSNNLITNINKVWLIGPLLDKLSEPPSAVQSKIIKASAALMESASVRANSLPSLNQTYLSTAAASTKFKERTLSQRGSASTNPSNLASTSLLGFQPFLSLLLSCLKNQDKERETLLTSLNSQLYQAIHEKVDDIGYKQSLQDGLELRLCLIGQMFDTIQKSTNLTSDWATLLLLLIMNNLVDPQVDYGLYVSVLDMLAMLIHTAYASDPIEQKEEAKKQYQNLMKKFRKELTALEEKGFIQMKHINPLMPLVRQMTEVITCEPMGSLVDTKGEKVENFYSIDKKKGLKVSELQEVSPWDLIEGHKNPAPLSWPWFGAVRLEQKPLRADENNRLMSWHTHTVHHTTAYFYQVPNLDDGGPSAKRSNSEKKPSQSNPLLKSLIEASDDSSSLLSKPSNKDSDNQAKENDAMSIENANDEHYIGREDLLEDYCELPVDSLFDSTPIETMIEDIKTAMQEHAAMTSRVKQQQQQQAPPPSQQQTQAPPPPPQMLDIKPPLTPQAAASSILAPVQPEPILSRSTTPQVSALSALQNHLNAASSIDSAPNSVPPPSIAMSPIIINPLTPEITMPARPPSNIPKVVPTPPPPITVARSPAVVIAAIATPPPPPAPKPKAPRKKRVTKKDTNANHAPVPAPPPVVVPQVPPVAAALHGMPQQQAPTMVVRRGPAQPQQPLVQQPTQQQQQQQHMQQQSSVYDFPSSYQPQPPQQTNQFVNSGPINPYYDQQQQQQQGPTNNMFNPQAAQQQQQQVQMQMGMQSQQHQHHPQQAPQHQMQQNQQQQHMQHLHQHHPIPYQQAPGQHQHQHGQHQPQQQHMQPQQIRISGHQQQQHHHQQQQQSMSFQQIQQQQQQQQHPHAQQQIFAPQQAAGHSRPALTAMLHQKHAAAGNPQPRFQFG